MKLGETCIHKNLKRQCETCEIADERDRLRNELVRSDLYVQGQYQAYELDIDRLKAELEDYKKRVLPRWNRGFVSARNSATSGNPKPKPLKTLRTYLYG